MTKEDVLSILETDISDPGSYKSGEYLEEHILKHARQIVNMDRSSLIEVLREWLNLRCEPRTMLAVTIARQLGLREIRSDIEFLRKDILEKKVFPFFIYALLMTPSLL